MEIRSGHCGNFNIYQDTRAPRAGPANGWTRRGSAGNIGGGGGWWAVGYAPRILVINDEPGARLLLERSLSDVGYNVTAAESGRVAFAHLRGRGFAVVIVDVSSLGPNAREIILQLRSEFPTLPVLAIFEPGTDPAQEALASEAHAAVPKPVSAEELLTKIYRLIEPRGTWAGE